MKNQIPILQPGEEILTGGYVNTVVRRGDKVLRCAMNSFVPGFLDYLEKSGFDRAPRFYGIDESGREILSYLEGDMPGSDETESQSCLWTEETLRGAARLLRSFHDVSAGFLAEAFASGWHSRRFRDEESEVICHNDAANYNMVFRNGVPWGLIDFDVAAPGPRLNDIAWTLYSFAPLGREEPDYMTGKYSGYIHERHYERRRKRVKLFFAEYGMEQPENFYAIAAARLNYLSDLLKTDRYRLEAEFIKSFFINTDQ